MNKEIKSLTGIRGVAAVYVAFYHWLGANPHRIPHSITDYVYNFVNHGYLSVDLFFILSGFVMALTYMSKFLIKSDSTYSTFLYKRFARLYPLYIFLLFVYIGLFQVLPLAKHNLSFNAIFLNIVMIQPWFSGPVIIPTSWSLSSEISMYILFPLFVRLLFFSKAWYQKIFILFFSIFVLFLISSHRSAFLNLEQSDFYGPLDLWSGPAVLIKCFSEFLLGMLIYTIMDKYDLYKILKNTKNIKIITSAISILLMGLLIFTKNRDIFIVMIMMTLVYLLIYDKGVVSQFLSSKYIYKLGLWSYSIYLIHPMPLMGVFRIYSEKIMHSIHIPFVHALSFLMMFFLMIFLSFLSFRFIELPAKNYLVKKINKSK